MKNKKQIIILISIAAVILLTVILFLCLRPKANTPQNEETGKPIQTVSGLAEASPASGSAESFPPSVSEPGIPSPLQPIPEESDQTDLASSDATDFKGQQLPTPEVSASDIESLPPSTETDIVLLPELPSTETDLVVP